MLVYRDTNISGIQGYKQYKDIGIQTIQGYRDTNISGIQGYKQY